MKRKLLAILLAACAAIACAFAFAACGEAPLGNTNGGNTEQGGNQGGNTGNGDKTPEPVYGSEGLNYTLSSNGTYYYLSGIGTCTETEITVANTYNGKPVTYIGDSAFKDCSELTSITIPNGVTTIGDWAFMDCSGLTSVTMATALLLSARVRSQVAAD